MKKVNPLKLTMVVIPLAIILTLLIRHFIGVMLGSSIHPAFTLVIYVILFAVLKIMGEKLVVEKAANQGKWSWFLSDEI